MFDVFPPLHITFVKHLLHDAVLESLLVKYMLILSKFDEHVHMCAFDAPLDASYVLVAAPVAPKLGTVIYMLIR